MNDDPAETAPPAPAPARAQAWTPRAQAAVARFDSTPSPFKQLTAHLLTAASRLVMRGFNRVRVHDGAVLDATRVAAREAGRGLLTFSNHVSLFDDPFVTTCVMSAHWPTARWIAADAVNFFGNAVLAKIFSAVKCVPVVRGAGLDQPGMEFLATRLEAGEWVHVFPEGGRTRDPAARLRRPFKPGMALLVQRCRPLLLPFHHHGMERVLPIGAWIPRVGNPVDLRFGQVTDSAAGLADEGLDAITAWAEAELAALEAIARAAAT